MKIVFKYSFQKEKEIISWFQKEKLTEPVNLILPKNDFKKSLDNDIQQKIRLVKAKWQPLEKDFFNIINKEGLIAYSKYICYLSRFGPSGFYQPPKTMVIRIGNKNDIKESNINICHELIHLIFRQNHREAGLSYIEQEKLVDNFLIQKKFKKILPKYPIQEFDIKHKG